MNTEKVDWIKLSNDPEIRKLAKELCEKHGFNADSLVFGSTPYPDSDQKVKDVDQYYYRWREYVVDAVTISQKNRNKCEHGLPIDDHCALCERGFDMAMDGECKHGTPENVFCNQCESEYQEHKTESDPSGKAQHEPGAKLDAGKIRPGLVLGGFARALWAVCEVGTKGAAKYSDNGWMEVETGKERYTDAGLRHFLKSAMGEDIDPDFDLLHMAHEAWNSLAKLELKLREIEAKNADQQ